MLSGDENETKPAKKSARKSKADQDGKKAEPRKRKSAPRKDEQPAQVLEPEVLEAAEAISAPVVPPEDSAMDVVPTEIAPVVEHAAAEADQVPQAQAEPLIEAAEQISTAVTPIESAMTEAAVIETSTIETSVIETSVVETWPSATSTAVPVPAENAAPVSYQAIADEYRRYTTESLDRTQTFFGRLAGVRSLDKAFELQSEFAKAAYDGFVAESLRIRELHSQLARQRLKQWEGFVARMIGPR